SPPSEEPKLTARALEVFAIIVLSLGTIGSAWGVYQSSSWNSKQSDLFNAANVARIESSKETTMATATIVYDVTLVAQSAAAVATGQTDLQQFYREKLFRPEFLPVVDRWLAEAGGDPTAVRNLVENEEYINDLLSKPRELEDEAQRLSVEAERASRIGDDYILVTVILATALFFAGTASSLSSIPLRIALLSIATLSLAVGAARLASLPLG
ncbi:MAG: hypothetical protein AB7N70_35370, partial [Dehalococcoidia bacterium]